MYNIAIDGPAGAGKSTIAKLVAQKLQFVYVDTGAMFRAIALYMIRNNVDLGDEKKVTAAAEKLDISIEYRDGEQQVLLNGENVSGEIRKEEVGNGASKVAVYGGVRTKLLELQRALAARQNVVMDGRDIGTAVLPHAQTKIYLTASSAVRAKRRALQLQEKGEKPDLEKIEADIIARDEQDKNRKIAPLRQAEDAVFMDSSDMSIDQVADAIIAQYEKDSK